jgi:hypothetical protein
MLSALPFFRLSNYLEAAFWTAVAVSFALAARRRPNSARRECYFAAITFLLFGLSDVVEAQTGAWYDPWWLLLWKALCLLSIARSLVFYLRAKRRRP